MAARHVGRRIGTVSSQHRAAERRRRSTPAAPHRVQRGKRETLTPGERRHLIQLVACGSIFVLLVAVKLLLPGRMAQVNAKLTGMLEQNIDVQAVFIRCGAGRERRSGCGRGPSGYVSGGVRPSGGFRRGGVSPGRGRGGVSPASCGHRAPAGLPDRDRQQRRLAGSARSSIPDGQRPRRQQRPIRQRRLRKPHPRARRRRLPWPTSSTPTRTCRTTCAWNRPCWALITAPR